jgi:tetratricopeptide (TPR) repeat protein
MTSGESRGGRSVLAPAAFIALAAFAAYGPSLRGGWLWDDGLEIAGNPLLRDPWGWWKSWTAPVGMDYFPLKTTLQWVQWHLWSGQVGGYHAVSLALHLGAAFLIWRILGKLGVRHGWLGGLLFAVHPVAVESVAWISEQKNTLSLAPLLLALDAFIDFDRAPDPASARPAYRRSVLWFLAAMLCKTTVAMFPVFLLLHAWWRRGRVSRADLRAAAPFFAVSLALGLATVWFQQHRAIGLGGPMPAFGRRLAQAGPSALAYLGQCVVPFRLMPVYPPAAGTLAEAGSWAGLAAILALLWVWRDTWGRHALLGIGWFYLNLFPVLGLVPMSYLRVAPRADHLAYLSLAGFSGLAAAGLAAGIDAWTRGDDRRRVAGLACAGLALAVVLVPSTRAYAGVFRDEGTLWDYAVRRNPGAWLARNNLGKVLLESGDPYAAVEQFQEAARIEPDSAEVRANLGNAYAREGRAGDARDQYDAAIRIDPGFAGAHYDLGCALLAAGDPASAAAEFQSALRLDPGSAQAHNNLGLAYTRLGRTTEALEEYARALAIDPDMPEGRLNLGNALFRLGKPQAAVEQYEAAIRADPRYAEAEYNLGYALRQLGRPDEAEAHFEAAARLGIGR